MLQIDALKEENGNEKIVYLIFVCHMPCTAMLKYDDQPRLFEPRSEKTGLQGFRPGPTQTGLYSYRRWLEA